MLEFFCDAGDEFVVLSMDAFNDELLLFLLSLMSFSLLTLLSTLPLLFTGDEDGDVSIDVSRGGIAMLRIFNSCLRSEKKRKIMQRFKQFLIIF